MKKETVNIHLVIPKSIHIYMKMHQLRLKELGIEKTMQQLYTEHLKETVGK